MKLHYQRVNPDIGGESILLRFEEMVDDRTVCLLVNSGRDVRIDTLLDESRDTYLAGIIVNNAHPENYCTLGENLREDTPVYASRDTARILSEALTDPHARDIERRSAVLEQLVSIDDWQQIVRGLQVHPVPSGHAPGAAGFLFEIADDGEQRDGVREQEQRQEQRRGHTLFVADEFTLRQAAGYPGIDVDLPVTVDTLLLSDAAETTTTPTSTSTSTPTLAETLSTICERVRNNATVLVTADEPTGIHAAYLLGHLGKRLGSPFPITVAGRIATLCEQLGFSIPNVTPLPDGTPKKLLTPGTVTIACPNAPVQGASGQLFEAIADDSTAAVIRLTNRVTTPMSAAQCMLQSFPWHNYPDRNTLDAIVDALSPVQVVLGDRNNIDETGGFDHDYDSFVWTIDDDLVYTLFDGTWVAPAETDPDIKQRVRQRITDRHDQSPSESELSLALPERQDSIDFAAEGLDIDVIQNRLLPAGSRFQSWRHSTANALTPGKRENDTSATDGGTTSIDASLAALREQIDDIESTVESRTYQANIIDAGDDVCLFRMQNPPASFEHGQDVTLVLDYDLNPDLDPDNAREMTLAEENGSETTDTATDPTNEAAQN